MQSSELLWIVEDKLDFQKSGKIPEDRDKLNN